jgi:hypothetical protein
MANQTQQRKKPITQLDPLPSLPSLQSLFQFQLLMTGTAADLVQPDLLLALGTTTKARFAARFDARSSLHKGFSFPQTVDSSFRAKRGITRGETGFTYSSCIDAPPCEGNKAKV